MAGGADGRRPPAGTSCREIALRLFADHGFENTTIEQIAAEAGVSERTFFRYFTRKASVLWADFDTEVATIRAALAVVSDDVPMMDAIRGAVVAANHYHAEDVPEMRRRMSLIATEPGLSFGAAEHYAAWERAVSEFAARRLGQPAESLYPLAIGRTCSPPAAPPMTAGRAGPSTTCPRTRRRAARGDVRIRPGCRFPRHTGAAFLTRSRR